MATRITHSPHRFILALFLSVSLFFLYHPIAMQGKFSRTLEMCKETDYTRDFLKRYDHPDILLIIRSPWRLADTGYTIIDFRAVNQYPDYWIRPLCRPLAQEILVVQRFSYSSNEPYPEDRLPEGHDLETLAEYQTPPHSFIRISRMKELKANSLLQEKR